MHLYHEPREIEKQIFHVSNEELFRQLALSEFFYQYEHNRVYRRYCDLIHISAGDVGSIWEIPFLPVELFKTQRVLAGGAEWEKVFSSSGTTGMEQSSHYVKHLQLYRRSFLQAFEYFYGPIGDYCLLALLPGYMENPNSSLIFMVRELIEKTGHPDSGFYLDNRQELTDKLRKLEQEGQKTLLLGVSFALLDLAEEYSLHLQHTLVMETGGMKGRRKELTRQELHGRLKEGLGVDRVHSEYGMAELLSQAYSQKQGRFLTPPWMKVMIRDYDDPFDWAPRGRSGGINVIDLANLYSCPFIETRDIGRILEDGSFEVLGRFDDSDVRGCSLLVVDE